nr:CAT [uncultured bacterium]
MFTFGKYYEDGGKYYIPLSIQVHHAVCDGFHVCRFLDELQDLLNK